MSDINNKSASPLLPQQGGEQIELMSEIDTCIEVYAKSYDYSGDISAKSVAFNLHNNILPILKEAIAECTVLPQVGEAKIIAEIIRHFCNAADNLGDMPVSESWAADWSNKASQLLHDYNDAPIGLGEVKAVAPEGWKIVPINPTSDMFRAANKLPESFSIGDEYRTMLDAAPVAQALPVVAETQKALINALDIALRQNEHDMLMTGEELRAGRAVLSAALQGEKA